MRPLRLTKAEAYGVRELVEGANTAEPSKTYQSILRKMDEAEADEETGVAAGPIEEALIKTSRGKVVKLAGGGLYARASKMATAASVTVEEAELVGTWLGKAGWFAGPTTIMTVLNKWGEWLPRAQASAPPPAAREGFDVGPSAAGSSPARQGGGSGGRGGPEGFR